MTPLVGFIGKHDLRIDDKGRLTIPARFKTVLQEAYPDDGMEVVVHLNHDNNLEVRPISEFEKMAESLERFPELDEDVRRMRETFFGFAFQEKIDGSGRIRIAPDLRELAGLDREVTCVGGRRSFVIWDRERWSETQAETLRNRRQITERVQERNRGNRSE